MIRPNLILPLFLATVFCAFLCGSPTAQAQTSEWGHIGDASTVQDAPAYSGHTYTVSLACRQGTGTIIVSPTYTIPGSFTSAQMKSRRTPAVDLQVIQEADGNLLLQGPLLSAFVTGTDVLVRLANPVTNQTDTIHIPALSLANRPAFSCADLRAANTTAAPPVATAPAPTPAVTPSTNPTPRSGSNCHYVSGYTRRNGTRVNGYQRCL